MNYKIHIFIIIIIISLLNSCSFKQRVVIYNSSYSSYKIYFHYNDFIKNSDIKKGFKSYCGFFIEILKAESIKSIKYDSYWLELTNDKYKYDIETNSLFIELNPNEAITFDYGSSTLQNYECGFLNDLEIQNKNYPEQKLIVSSKMIINCLNKINNRVYAIVLQK